MSSDDPNFINLVAGVTKGTLAWSSDTIKDYVARFRNRDLAFIRDHETIDLAREQRHTNEWESLYSKYLKNPRLRILAQAGLALRRIENDKKRVDPLRGKILKGFGKEGLHIAEAVQNEILSTFIVADISQFQSATDLTNQIEKLLNNVDRYTIFVGPDDDVGRKAKEVEIRIIANAPSPIIIYGCRKEARQKVDAIIKKLGRSLTNYEITQVDSGIKTIIIIREKIPILER